MSWYKDQIPILVNYQGTHDPYNNPNLALGTDYSNTYSRNKSCLLYVADEYSQIAVGLKAFLKSFSISLKIEHSDTQLIEGKKHNVENLGFTYSLEVVMPAVSVNDARVNADRLEMLEIILQGQSPTNNTGSTGETIPTTNVGSSNVILQAVQNLGQQTNIPRDYKKFVLLSNLINNGKYTNKKSIETFENIKNYGLPCYIQGISYNAIVESGFFEYDRKLWPKEYSLKLELTVLTKYENKFLCNVFNDDGTLQEEYTTNGSWPFGVNTL